MMASSGMELELVAGPLAPILRNAWHLTPCALGAYLHLLRAAVSDPRCAIPAADLPDVSGAGDAWHGIAAELAPLFQISAGEWIAISIRPVVANRFRNGASRREICRNAANVRWTKAKAIDRLRNASACMACESNGKSAACMHHASGLTAANASRMQVPDIPSLASVAKLGTAIAETRHKARRRNAPRLASKPLAPLAESATTERRPARRPIADGFAVSERVAAWAARSGFDRLQDHRDAFVRICAAHGYRYVDHDAAFMEAIRKDWARLRQPVRTVAPVADRVPGGAALAWMFSCQGTDAKARELGLSAQPGETYENLRQRIMRALADQARAVQA